MCNTSSFISCFKLIHRSWDTKTMMTSSIKLFPHPCFVYAAQYHPGSPYIIVTGGYDHYLRVWTKLSEGMNGKVCFCGDNLVLTLTAINSSRVAAVLTLKANWRDTLTVKQWEIMISNDVLLFSVTNEKTPYEQLLHYHQQWRNRLFMNGLLTGN